jgi:hypothetical protein
MYSLHLAKQVPQGSGPPPTDGEPFFYIHIFSTNHANPVVAPFISWRTPTVDEALMPMVGERRRTVE